jgi:hypothetical protein
LYKSVLAFVKCPEIAKVTSKYEYFLTDSIGAPLTVNLVAFNLPVLGKQLVFNADSFFDKLCKNVIIENVHKHFCKYLLEVTKRGSNIAVMGELGRYPLYIKY